METVYKPIRALAPETARKIAAGEVIDRPAAVVREFLDNALDAGASKIQVEITNGGIDRIRVSDNGCGMSKEDLQICTDTHTTSKITTAEDLLALHSLGFRGEALSSIKAVSDLEITSTREGPAAWKLQLGKILPARLNCGTVIQTEHLFENFPARKQFLKRPAAETALCRTVFIDKALPHYNTELRFVTDGTPRFTLLSRTSLRERCLDAFSFKEPEKLFFEIEGSGEYFSFHAVLGSPDVIRSDKRSMLLFVNGRRITEFGLVQAIEYGCEGYFPNGGHPVAVLFLTVDPARIDFNIHPAKKEARFQDYGAIHHAVSSSVSAFYRQHTVASLLKTEKYNPDLTRSFDFLQGRTAGHHSAWSEKTRLYAESLEKKYPSFSEIASLPPRTYSSTDYPQTAASVPIPYSSEQNHFDTPPADFKLLGQVAGTFIAVEKNETLYLIDQHAAHERIIFEQLKNNIGGRQALLIPYRIVTACDEDDAVIRKNKAVLCKAGFAIFDEGAGVWQVTATPARWVGTEQDLARDIADARKHAEDILHHILASAACRAACKDHAILDPLALHRLASQTFALPEPLCPHGRPLWIMLTREELFKRIKRTR